jgi:hypothetical protein
MSGLVNLVEMMQRRGRGVPEIVAAIRDYEARRAARPGQGSHDSAPPPWSVWIAADSPEGRAWRAHWLRTKGMAPPMDRRFGWRFPSRWPRRDDDAAL